MEAIVQQKAIIIGILKDHPYLILAFFATLIIVAYIILALKQPNVLNIFTFAASLFRRKNINPQYEKQLVAMEERHEKHLIGIEKLLRIDKDDREKRQAEWDTWQIQTDNRLTEVCASVDKIFSMLADHEEFANDVSRGTLENMLCNDSVSTLRRLKAFVRLIAMGANGILKKTGMKLIVDNKDLWLEVLAMNMDFEIVNKDYYEKVMEEIRKNIFGGVM